MWSRRHLLGVIPACGPVLAIAHPGLALATAPTDRRLVLVLLRGGWDALNVLAPLGDPDYARLRPNIALPRNEGIDAAIDLGGGFGLHPSLEPLLPAWRARQLLFVQAVAGPDRTRSHFDAQDTLENGATLARGRNDGWLNRALLELAGAERQAIAVGQVVPLALRGQAAVRSWAPAFLPEADASFLDKVAQLYAEEPVLRASLQEGRRSAEGANRALGERQTGMATPRRDRAFPALAEAAGKLLAAIDGPRIATIECEGWDTHVNQPLLLRQSLTVLADGLRRLEAGLGEAWPSTVVMVVSEFGRTAAENGGRGTDHGTGGLALLLGGAVIGGRVAGRWPGLEPGALLDGRDLSPTTDLRAVFKGVLDVHLGVREAALEEQVFPDSRGAGALDGLVRRPGQFL